MTKKRSRPTYAILEEFKTRGKALFDGSNESQNVTGYENV